MPPLPPVIPSRAVLERVMTLALAEARKAESLGEVPVGAVIANLSDGAVIATAHNTVEGHPSATCHAEMLAIERASSQLGRWRLSSEFLCVTLEPCTMCAGAVLNARIPVLVYGATEERTGACGSMYDLFANSENNFCHVIRGVHERESRELMKNFFKVRRQ